MMKTVKKQVKNELTAPVEEGPYYKDGSPETRVIATEKTEGKKIIMEGTVRDKDGNPIPHAWLDFWQADGRGKYDNQSYTLRGHQYADENGHYRLETVRPLEYLMRSPHIHVKVRAHDQAPVFTTQLFFPGEKTNATDFLFDKRTLMNVKDTPDGLKATFDFVVET
jgi:protocatechuate 3,4-dioxygenase beta subunit